MAVFDRSVNELNGPSPMPTLHIQLFGDLQLLYGDAPLRSINTARLQSLFGFLLLHRQSPQNRQQLAFQFWPDSTEAKARANLRFFLHRLRRALPDADHFIEITESNVHWRLDAPFTLDVAAFENALTDAEQLTGEAELSALERAIALYRGDLLPACYDEWILPERERLQQLYTRALEQLVSVSENQHQYRAAIDYAQRLLRHDPLHEETYRQLMRLYEQSGDRVGALRAFHTCAAVLERELAVEPGPATRAQYEQLLHVPAAMAPTTPPALPAYALLSAPGAPPNNLRLALTSFVGRTQEISTVKQLLATTRLVTLTGMGGAGKTRLALEVTTQLLLGSGELHPHYADGIWWVELAPLTDPADVVQAVVAALQVREQQLESLSDTLIQYLHPKRALLVLDNCEHLIGACAELAEKILRTCPGVSILATSREPLKLEGERSWAVPPLSLPEHAARTSAEVHAKITQSEAVRLFNERAGAAFPAFELTPDNAASVIQVCRELDGLPLAIELAAARVKTLSVKQIAARLDDRFCLLQAGYRRGNARHQSLRKVMDWSFELLAPPERLLFSRLAVFVGGFTLEAVEAVCGGDGIETSQLLELVSLLVDKSLVRVHQAEGEPRFDFLETIREYANEKLLESNQAQAMQNKHTDYYLAFAERAAVEFEGPTQRLSLERMELEHDNVRAALRRVLERRDADTALRLGSALGHFWNRRGYLAEGRQWLEATLAVSEGVVSPARASALLRLGELVGLQEDNDTARLRLEQSLDLWQAMGDRRGMSEAMVDLAHREFFEGDWVSAHRRLEQGLALARDVGDKRGVAFALYRLGHLTMHEGDIAAAREQLESSLRLFREMGWKSSIALVLNGLGELARSEGDFDRAAELYAESLSLYQELADKWRIAVLLNNSGFVALHRGEESKAKTAFIESLKLWRVLDAPRLIPESLVGLAGVSAAAGMCPDAVRLLSVATALRDANGLIWEGTDRADLEWITALARRGLEQSDFERAWFEATTWAHEQAVEHAMALVERLP